MKKIFFSHYIAKIMKRKKKLHNKYFKYIKMYERKMKKL